MAEKLVVIDLDQAVELTVRVTVGKPLQYKTDISLSQEVTAPLYVVKTIQVGQMASTLFERVLPKFVASLHEEMLEELRAKERACETEEVGESEKEEEEE